MTERKAFKYWFDAALVDATAQCLAAVEPRFDGVAFRAAALDGLDELEMIARVAKIADALRGALPQPTRVALSALVRSMDPPLHSADGVTEAGYRLWPYGEYIARYGLDDVDASFEAMTELTQRFSAEFAVRPFLAADVDGALDRLESLVEHPNQHVRRWVSEGTRSRLPWGKRVPALEQRAARRLEMLSRLRHDPERYVQRSVANHLQDLLKDDRDLAFPTLAAWVSEGSESTLWIARHAARGLLKAGDPDAMRLFGFGHADADVVRFAVEPDTAAIGESVRISVAVRNVGATSAPVRLDYLLESPGARGGTNRKVFRFADVVLEPGESAERAMSHAFVHRSIRTVRPGCHRFTLQLDGRPAGSCEVTVVDAPTD